MTPISRGHVAICLPASGGTATVVVAKVRFVWVEYAVAVVGPFICAFKDELGVRFGDVLQFGLLFVGELAIGEVAEHSG